MNNVRVQRLEVCVQAQIRRRQQEVVGTRDEGELSTEGA